MNDLKLAILAYAVCEPIFVGYELNDEAKKAIREADDDGYVCFLCHGTYWKTPDTNGALAALVNTSEISGVLTAADMDVAFGFDPQGGTLVVSWKDLDSGLWDFYQVSASAEAVKAVIRLFIEGDEGNEKLYKLAEPVMCQMPAKARCIP